MQFTEKQRSIIKKGLLAAFFLLVFRLIFFLQDGTSDLIESILIYVIAAISLLIIVLVIFFWWKQDRQLLKNYFDLVILSGLIIISEFAFILENQLDLTIVTLFSILFIIVVLDFMIAHTKNRLRSILVYFFLIFLPIYLIMQDLYFYIFKSSAFFSFAEIVTIREGLEFREGVMEFDWIQLFYGLLMIVAVATYSLLRRHYQVKRLKFSYKNLSIIGLFFLLMNFNSAIPPKTARLHLSDHYLYISVYSSPKFFGHFGATNYLFRDLGRSIVPDIKTSSYVKEIDDYFASHPKSHEDNQYSGLFAGKNLLFIVAESFDYMALNETLTPNIYKIMTEGWHFNNHYVPVYPRTTCDTEIIYNTGLIPSVADGPTCYDFNRNSYSTSLANIFNQAGYLTQAFHSNDKEFYTRYLVYEGFGYDAFYGQHEIGLDNTQKRYDSLFFEMAADLILPDEQPFMSFVLTLSGHSPYENNHLAIQKHYATVDQYYGNRIPEEIKRYIAAQIEADRLLGVALESLESKGLLEDTIIIFTTDHYPYTLKESAYEKYTGIKSEYLKMRSPLIIWGKDMVDQGMEINRLTSSFDVLPTIANLFGLNVNYSYYFGYDVFDSAHQEIVFYKDRSWFDGDNFVLYGKQRKGSGNKQYIDEMTKKVNAYFEIGKKILRANYFKVNVQE